MEAQAEVIVPGDEIHATSRVLSKRRTSKKERGLVDLNDIVRRTFALRSYHLTTLNITVTLDLDPTDPKAWASGAEMQQMLLNLHLYNAGDTELAEQIGPDGPLYAIRARLLYRFRTYDRACQWAFAPSHRWTKRPPE